MNVQKKDLEFELDDSLENLRLLKKTVPNNRGTAHKNYITLQNKTTGKIKSFPVFDEKLVFQGNVEKMNKKLHDIS